jgi:hypothetical protein
LQTQDKTVTLRMYTCPNAICGQTFTLPLKALNLQDSSGPYNACPFCLTKVTAENESEVVGKIDDEANSESNAPERTSAEPPSQETVDCNYHFGYLNERQVKDQIPDGCLVCRSIVPCMLKRMES